MSNINSNTRFRKFNFTLYERLDTLKNRIIKLFNTESCSFSILKFQFESNHNSDEYGKYHAQGFAKVCNGQLRLGNYNSKTNKGSGIKEFFKANVHNPNSKKGEKCKCDFNDLSKICKFCNENCERTFSCISEDLEVAGPFEFIFDENKFNPESKEENEEIFYEMVVKEVMNGADVDDTIVKYANKYKNWGRTTQGLRDIAKAIKSKTLNPLYNINRYWKLIVIYIYGDKRTGKSKICKDLFPGIYEKADNEWWEKYNNEEFNYNRDISILLDNFYGSCSWTNLLRLADRNHCEMNVKYGKTYIVAMYIYITANGPIENLYTRLRKTNSSIDIGAFIQRVKFIIKYEGESIDENGKCDIIRIFEKGNKKEFNKRIFDIEFNKGTILEEVEKVTLDLGIGEIYQDVKTGLFYWRQSWNNIINKYSIIEDIDDKTDRIVTNIPKSDSGERILVSSSEKRKKNQTYQDPQEESSKTEKSLQNIEKNLKRKLLNNSLISKNIISELSKKRKLSISESESNNSIEYDSSVSNYHSDDSDYTKDLKRQPKINGKRKIKNSDKNNNTQQEKQQKFNNINTIDTEQIQIQQFYQKSLEAKENIEENNNDDFDMCEDIELDISEETTYEEFNRKNKNNSLYLGFKSICKKI